MSLTEFAVIVFGLFAGYWVVGKLFFRRPPAPPPAGDQARAAPAPPVDAPPWYDVLEVAPTAAPAEVDAAYQRLRSQYHPDKVASLGQELQDLATQKSQQISAAYRDALRARDRFPPGGTAP
jgi:DnaJ like chaperone protein